MRGETTICQHGQWLWLGGSPGLLVMGGDSRSEGRGFKSQPRILDGYFSHIFDAKNCDV